MYKLPQTSLNIFTIVIFHSQHKSFLNIIYVQLNLVKTHCTAVVCVILYVFAKLHTSLNCYRNCVVLCCFSNGHVRFFCLQVIEHYLKTRQLWNLMSPFSYMHNAANQFSLTVVRPRVGSGAVRIRPTPFPDRRQ